MCGWMTPVQIQRDLSSARNANFGIRADSWPRSSLGGALSD
jgi:hypothetical protein